MKVLVACEESQIVCLAFRSLGHEAYSADLLQCSGGFPEFHILGDVLPLINGNCNFSTVNGDSHFISGKWDLIIAHPPCTFLTSSGACRLYSNNGVNLDRYKKGLQARDFFLKLFNADCERICIENPTPLRIYNLPRYSQIIEPYMFGDNATKRTCLWLKGLPFLCPTDYLPRPVSVKYIGYDGSVHYKCWTQNQSSAFKRSKTFPGIARAMAAQFSTFEDLQLHL